MAEPRGERDNNPGNLEGGIAWRGLLGHDGPYDTFDTVANGLRALALDLINQQRLHGLRTIGDIIPKFAPAADHNNVAAYIAAVCAETGWQAGQQLDLTQPATLVSLMRAVIAHENGACPYSVGQLGEAALAALNPEKPMPAPETPAVAPSPLTHPVMITTGATMGAAGAAGVLQYAQACVSAHALLPLSDPVALTLGGGLMILCHLLSTRLAK